MSQTRISEIREQLFSLEGQIRPLQWDFDRKQINPFKAKKLEELSAQKNTLQEELSSLENAN